MTKPNDGGPAFPIQAVCTADGNPVESMQPGMSLRDYFAAQALIGVMASYNSSGYDPKHPNIVPQVAEISFMLADAMIKRSKSV